MPADFLLGLRWRAVVFAAGGRSYDWLDVFLAAMWRGDWTAFDDDLVEGLAYQEGGVDPDGAPLSDRDKLDAADDFRYARGLIAADDIVAWLERSGLTVESWDRFLERRLLRDRWRARVGRRVRPAAVPLPADIDVAAEGICSAVFDRFAQVLAGRAATAAGGAGDRVASPDPPRLDRVCRDYQTWLTSLDGSDVRERLAHIASLDAAFAHRAGAVVSAAALASQVSRHRREWTRVDLERLAFAEADAAREAACCVRDDGRSLTDVAIDLRQPVRDTCDVLARLEPGLRDAVLSADIGELVGPIPVGPRLELVSVVAKRPPDVADPLVRTLAAEALVHQMVGRAVTAHVRWHTPDKGRGTAKGALIA